MKYIEKTTREMTEGQVIAAVALAIMHMASVAFMMWSIAQLIDGFVAPRTAVICIAVSVTVCIICQFVGKIIVYKEDE